MLAYLALRRGDQEAPLFLYRDGSPLTRSRFVGVIKDTVSALGLPGGDYAGHSFRAGAATMAAKAGIEGSVIQTLGQWRSLVYKLYVRIPQEELGETINETVPGVVNVSVCLL